ncbi:Ribose-phosphate pyrophosphokinase 2 [Smittium culicis]|uniref:ribose-phosphate diphosphokinase n=1 Tax=Smittium culicis TaxID=133412 RepID=A0A1R1XMW4_9FUNG|nr:Ribose-phosphate pyrophosphokinase 2 [Smittium culicis]OMJ20945.1 Ribose-phosphate pyrophosphokinase 2 [Smittium culicis]
MKDIALISGSSHPELGEKIAKYLGIVATPAKLGKFSNQETNVEIQKSVRGKHVYILQTSCGKANDNLIELLIIIQACRFGSAKKISVVTPLLMYSIPFELKRQSVIEESCICSDGEVINHATLGYKSWEAKPGKLVTSLIEAAGADHLIAMDLHEPEYQGFFTVPVDVVYAEPVIIDYIKNNVPNYQNAIVVSPDAGGVKRAASICNKLDLNFALIHNNSSSTASRSSNTDNDSNCENASSTALLISDASINGSYLIGNVENRPVIMIDDIGISGHTLVTASNLLQKNGCVNIYAIVIHGCFTENSIKLLENSPITKIACTNSIELSDSIINCKKIDIIDASVILGETIRRTFNGESVSHLYSRDLYN